MLHYIEMPKRDTDFSLVDIQAWNLFANIGGSDDLLGRRLSGNIYEARALCKKNCPTM